MIELNRENFDEVISKGIVLVDFYSKQCAKCKLIEQTLESLSNEFNLTFAKLDVRENKEIARRYGIIGLPILVLFRNGEVLRKLKPKSRKDVEEFIRPLK
ncbi:thiol reductase thioredoxin [Archaeoglobales archaeon]|nr:MAG: thiol reductase thioredoxin [Archaeoglobales archaeon]